MRLGLFSPSPVLAVATATGALRRAGLDVEEVPARSSAGQLAELAGGALDAALTSPDNVLAHRFDPPTDAAATAAGGTAAGGTAAGGTVDVRVVAAIDRGLGLSLLARPGLVQPGLVQPGLVQPGLVRPDRDALGGGTAAARLRGSRVGVDVATSGFAFVAYALLDRLGLGPSDYRADEVGTTPRRAELLLRGEVDCAVLNAGADLRAEAAGCTRLARARALGPYLGTVLAARGADVAARRPQLSALTGVLVCTAAALAGGDYVDIVVSFARDRLRLAPAQARGYAGLLADPEEGLVPDGHVDDAALATLLRLRGRWARTPVPDRAPGLLDLRLLPTAAGSG